MTALRHLRGYMIGSTVDVETAYLQAPYVDASYAPHDYESALTLHAVIDPGNDLLEFPAGLRAALNDIVAASPPAWLSLAPRGRRHVIDALVDEASTEHLAQVFRSAELLDPNPNDEATRWWDNLASNARALLDARFLAAGRAAEIRSLMYETERLRAAACPFEPAWVAIDDNLAGFDIATWDLIDGLWREVALEVKSSAGKPRFHLSRNEFEAALRWGIAYRIHLWSGETLSILDGLQVVHAAPTDGARSKWQEAIFDTDPLNL